MNNLLGFIREFSNIRVRTGSSTNFAGIRKMFLMTGHAVIAAAFVVLLAAGTAQGSPDPLPGLSKEGSWTLCLYLCGSNLESRQGWATKTLKELQDTDIPDNVTVIVQAGGAHYWKNEDVQQDGQRLLVKDGKLYDAGTTEGGSMGEAAVLADFLEFCQSEYPAEHTAVFFWNHGGGPLKGVCFDENASFDSLSLNEMSEALAKGVGARILSCASSGCLMRSIRGKDITSFWGSGTVWTTSADLQAVILESWRKAMRSWHGLWMEQRREAV